MAMHAVIDVDLAEVYAQPGRKEYLHTLAWGDYVDVLETTDAHVRIRSVKYQAQPDGSILPVDTEAFICPTKASKIAPSEVIRPRADNRVLKVNFVDVQQGDGAVIESPQGKVVLIDGGDNQMFARYLAARFRGTRADQPQPVECIVVSHGDADHFSGLSKIFDSETHTEPRKRLFIAPKRVYHNGLVKRPEKDKNKKTIPEKKSLGATKTVAKQTIITGLEDDLLGVPDEQMNRPFREWKSALAAWHARSPIAFRRLSFGDDDAFDFLRDENVDVRVLGPFMTVKGATRGLKFLGTPPKGPRLGHESVSMAPAESASLSASHTINGHSIVLGLRYGKAKFLFSGDLNDEAGRELARRHEAGDIDLRADVFKVPHHGSADFSGAFLQRVAPVVSVVSSGDESARKEYIHPRATLMGALGRVSRVEEPLIFVTELVAFMNLEGWARLTNKTADKKRGSFFAFSRTAYGIVKTRTDGEHLLIYTDSGKADLKEAYRYRLDDSGVPVPEPLRRV
jgi:beta-lactamase superfamily II metal-dependent hydrolase